jgi:hypothetical protein
MRRASVSTACGVDAVISSLAGDRLARFIIDREQGPIAAFLILCLFGHAPLVEERTGELL